MYAITSNVTKLRLSNIAIAYFSNFAFSNKIETEENKIKYYMRRKRFMAKFPRRKWQAAKSPRGKNFSRRGKIPGSGISARQNSKRRDTRQGKNSKRPNSRRWSIRLAKIPGGRLSEMQKFQVEKFPCGQSSWRWNFRAANILKVKFPEAEIPVNISARQIFCSAKISSDEISAW